MRVRITGELDDWASHKIREASRPEPRGPSPFIVGDPFWGAFRCHECGGVFYSDEPMLRPWRIRRWRVAHDRCVK